VHFIVQPSSLTGGVADIPGDKSISHRALMLSAIAEGTAHISGFLTGEDCLATMAALQAMGIEIEHDGASSLTVHGKGMHGLAAADAELDMGNSGTAMRLFSGLLCGQPYDSVLRGDASLSGRPMNRVIQPLAKMGARIRSKGGRPPLSIAGGQKLHGIDYDLPVASAQVKSAVLIAGLYAKGITSVTQPAITRDHTERMLSSMGVALDQSNNTVSLRGGATLQAVNVEVPADLSSAAFALVAAIVADDCEVVVKNVGVNPTRTGVLEILQQMGADIRIENERLMGQEPVADIIARSSSLSGIDVEPSLVPLAIDEFPLLFAAAAMANGKTRFSGIAELRVKESDRIGSMVSGLAQLGIEVTESADGAVIHGGTIGGGTVQSFGDHRIAMAFASVASGASDTVLIEDTDTVSTSFPGFMDCMKSIGVNITTSTGGK
jgi:3-phosphoshikimate 1-carboxyvinyltransferase